MSVLGGGRNVADVMNTLLAGENVALAVCGTLIVSVQVRPLPTQSPAQLPR
jgi:hypothetical protein